MLREKQAGQGRTLLLGSLGWLASYYILANYLGRWLPVGVKRLLLRLDPEGGGLQSWSSVVWLLTGLVVFAAAHRRLRSQGAQAGLALPAKRLLLWGLFLAPVALALSAYVAWNVALPTILRELAEGGTRAVQRNSGAFGRSLKQTPTAMVLFWGVGLAPLAEELLFRGGLWSGLREIFAPDEQPKAPTSVKLVFNQSPLSRLVAKGVGWLTDGGLATLVTAALFAYLHWDMPGGVGILRLTQTLCLGLFLGELRHRSGSVWPCVILHMLFNALTLSKLRKWWVSDGWPSPLPIPVHWWQLAAVGILAAMVLAWLSRQKKNQAALDCADSESV